MAPGGLVGIPFVWIESAMRVDNGDLQFAKRKGRGLLSRVGFQVTATGF